MSTAQHIIVGAGQAGGHAAMAMRAAGFAGRILLIGAELLRPYERPPLSKAVLTETPEPGPLWFHDAARIAEAGIELHLGVEVEALDTQAARITLRGGESLAYDRLLLATGGRARRLDAPGGEAILTLRDFGDALDLRARLMPGAAVLCVGAGVIGLEIAASARARGCEVTVIEAGPAAMGRSLTPEFAAMIADLHARAGVKIHFNTALAGIDGRHVVCTNGVALQADVVVAGVGISRNTAFAQAAGIACDNGILVDALGRSSADGVFAAGDVTAFFHPFYGRHIRLEAWRHAQNHGIAVGRTMAGQGVDYDEIPWFWSDQHGVNLQVAGLPDPGLTTVMRGERMGFHLDATGCVAAATGMDAQREIRAAQALIRARKPVDPAMLADPGVTPQKLAALVR
jgi:NADPH-dependent 2,4-dienoyl-CoA reductase/sulfur reductase-like enzyme